jgi:hypothetical protein
MGKASMMIHACNPSSQEAEGENSKFEDSLSCLKKKKKTKELNRYFTKEHIWMSNKYTKICQT